jgi:hypothetical protein
MILSELSLLRDLSFDLSCEEGRGEHTRANWDEMIQRGWPGQ